MMERKSGNSVSRKERQDRKVEIINLAYFASLREIIVLNSRLIKFRE
jgi:hypothetical protein